MLGWEWSSVFCCKEQADSWLPCVHLVVGSPLPLPCCLPEPRASSRKRARPRPTNTASASPSSRSRPLAFWERALPRCLPGPGSHRCGPWHLTLWVTAWSFPVLPGLELCFLLRALPFTHCVSPLLESGLWGRLPLLPRFRSADPVGRSRSHSGPRSLLHQHTRPQAPPSADWRDSGRARSVRPSDVTRRDAGLVGRPCKGARVFLFAFNIVS